MTDMKEYRRANRVRLNALSAIRRNEWRRELLHIVGEGRCKDCGNHDERVLIFDHLSDKICNVARLLDSGWDKALTEAKKCEVVCANCHAIRTRERMPIPTIPETAPWQTLSKDVCPKGHPKTPENRYEWKGKVYCRPCRAEAARNARRAA